MTELPIEHPVQFVHVVRLNRPHALNVLSCALLVALGSTLQAASHNDDVRVVVLTGNERVFSSGADLKEPNASHLFADRF